MDNLFADASLAHEQTATRLESASRLLGSCYCREIGQIITQRNESLRESRTGSQIREIR
jgi:hypothetical protein